MKIRYYHHKSEIKRQIAVNDRELPKGLSREEISKEDNEEARAILLEKRNFEFNRLRGKKIKQLLDRRLINSKVQSENCKKRWDARIAYLSTPCNVK